MMAPPQTSFPIMFGTDRVPPPLDDVEPGDLPTYAVDFESYYDKECTVKTLGNWAYCHHPLFDAYLVSIYGPGICYVGHPSGVPWHLISGKGFRWISHNAGFDEEVQFFLIETGVIPPTALPEEWHCTADLSAFLGAPRSLQGALMWLRQIKISKDTRTEMKGKRWSEMTPDFQREVVAYALDDGIHCRDNIWKEYSAQWPLHERRLSVHTRRMGRRGLRLNVPLLEEGIAKLQTVKDESRKLIPWAPEDAGVDKGVLAVTKLREVCEKAGIEAPDSLAKDSTECQEWEEKYGDQFPWVAAMRDFRRANILLRKLTRMKSRLKPDGRMTFSLKYFGASITGRWAGDGGWNSQNQNKEAVFGVDPRKIIIPDPDKEFLIADSSQIEPRCLHYLAGNKAFLDRILEGFGIYEAFAVKKGRWPAEKKGLLKKEDPKTYAWAKAAVLGLGYGCGWAKFIEVARILAGLELNEDESRAMVSDFRATETYVTALWYRLQEAMGLHIGRDFHVELPSGRVLRYRDVQVEDNGLSAEIVKNIHNTEKILRLRYWGGILTENLVQATAREVFASIILRLEAAGIDVVMHVHDEVVCEVSKGATEEERLALKVKVEAIMSATPGFLKGCPLACELQYHNAYTK